MLPVIFRVRAVLVPKLFERSAHAPDLTDGWPEALRKYDSDDLVITTLGLLTYFLREVHSSSQSFRSKIPQTM